MNIALKTDPSGCQSCADALMEDDVFEDIRLEVDDIAGAHGRKAAASVVDERMEKYHLANKHYDPIDRVRFDYGRRW